MLSMVFLESESRASRSSPSLLLVWLRVSGFRVLRFKALGLLGFWAEDLRDRVASLTLNSKPYAGDDYQPTLLLFGLKIHAKRLTETGYDAQWQSRLKP